MRLRPFFDRRVDLMRIVTTLNITLISAMRGYNAVRAATRHSEQCGNHVLHENLSEASELAVSGGVTPQLICRRLGLRRIGARLGVIGMRMR
jgi:hypothetical protein